MVADYGSKPEQEIKESNKFLNDIEMRVQKSTKLHRKH